MEKSIYNSTKSLRQRILDEMRDGMFSDSERLPRENVLAEQLGISRTQLRDILASLEREGFISRRHGVGTLINRHVLNVANRMDLEVEFMDMIRCAGKQPGLGAVSNTTEACDEYIAKRLQLTVGEEVMRVEKTVTANGHGAIYCQDFFATSLIKDTSWPLNIFEQPIFYFLEQYCQIVAFMDLAEISAVAASKEQSRALNIVQGTPLLCMDELDYDITGHPVLYSRQYYVDGVIRHTVLRKKI